MADLEVMQDIAREAGQFIKDSFDFNHAIADIKDDGSLVSDVDRVVEELIYRRLQVAFPGCEFLGEEGGLRQDPRRSKLFWADPLDGTHNFLNGIPIFATSLAEIELDPVRGVTYDPMHQEMFLAERREGSFLNGKLIGTSTVDDLAKATIGFSCGSRKEDKEKLGEIYAQLRPKIRNSRILGAVTLHYAYVACGRFDALVDIGNQPWDVAAGVLLIQEPRGKVTDTEGYLYTLDQHEIVASNGTALHDKILEVVGRIH